MASSVDIIAHPELTSQVALVARINLSDNLYQWRKFVSNRGNRETSAAEHSYVTALAVNPAGTKLAVYASDVPTSEVNSQDTDSRSYRGSNKGSLFVINTADGSYDSRVMDFNHGTPANLNEFQVLSSGMRFMNNGYVYIALSMHPRTETDLHYSGTLSNGKIAEGTLERVACYDPANESVIFYY